MHSPHPEGHAPLLAVTWRNTLASMGLATLIEEVMPVAVTRIFSSPLDIPKKERSRYFHFFTSVAALMEAPEFFRLNAHKTIVVTEGDTRTPLPEGFRTLDATLPRHELIRSFLMMEQAAHGGGRRLPEDVREQSAKSGETAPHLTARETEVLREIVKGYINKEIATHLNISLTTVITHRKNIVEKLHARSVSQLTIYAVSRGIVRPEEI